MAQLVSRHSCVADRLPVVVRFPAGPRVRFKYRRPAERQRARTKKSVGAGDTERCRRNAERLAIMVGVLTSQRHRAMFMMQTMDDISPEQSESEGENTESTND